MGEWLQIAAAIVVGLILGIAWARALIWFNKRWTEPTLTRWLVSYFERRAGRNNGS